MIHPATAAIAPAPAGGAILTKATLRAAANLGLSQGDLAEVLGVSAASVSRLVHGRTLSPESKEGELALLFLRVFRSLDTLMGGDASQSRAWLHAENRHVGGVPADRLRSVVGLVAVAEYLDAVRGRL